MRVSLDWETPDDYDLEVYRKQADGELVQVGSSGNLPAEKEFVEIYDAAAGTYVLRVINYASASPTYTLEAALVEETVTGTYVVPGKTERWTLTCEKGGTVLDTLKVVVDRGEVARVDLSACRKR